MGMISKIKPRMFMLNLKNGKWKRSIIVYITEEICSWLSTFHKQTGSPFTPPAENLYRLVEVHCVHNFEQPPLLWAVTAGLRAGLSRSWLRAVPGRAAKWPGNCRPDRADFRPVHISTHQSLTAAMHHSIVFLDS